MYVCVCKRVTDSDIRKAVETGHGSLPALMDELGLCTQCGRCAQCAVETIREALAANPALLQAA